MSHISTAHEVLAVVFQVRGVNSRKPALHVLLWQRALEPEAGKWSLPGGRLGDDEDMTSSVRRQLAEKVDLRELAHLEQLAVFSDPHRVPGVRTIASTFLGLVPSPATPELPPDTQWHPVSELPPMAFDHGPMVEHARTRLVAKSPTRTSDLPSRQGNSHCPHCGTSTARRWAIRSTPPTFSACSSVVPSSPAPGPRRGRDAAVAAPPRCTASPTRDTG